MGDLERLLVVLTGQLGEQRVGKGSVRVLAIDGLGGDLLTGVGRNQLMVRLAVVGATVNLIGSIAAAYWLGPIGPAIGSMPAVLVIDFTILPVIVCRHLDIPFRRYARDAFLPVLPVAAVAGLVAVLLLAVVPSGAHATTFRSGVKGLVEAATVVLAAWAVMGAVILRIEPDVRRVVVTKLRRRSA